MLRREFIAGALSLPLVVVPGVSAEPSPTLRRVYRISKKDCQLCEMEDLKVGDVFLLTEIDGKPVTKGLMKVVKLPEIDKNGIAMVWGYPTNEVK